MWLEDLTRPDPDDQEAKSFQACPLRPGYQPRCLLPRQQGWRPLFGQSGAAQGHLDNQGVQSRRSVPIFWSSSKRLRKLLAGGTLSKMRLGNISCGVGFRLEKFTRLMNYQKMNFHGRATIRTLHPSRDRISEQHAVYCVRQNWTWILDLSKGAGCFLKFHRTASFHEPNRENQGSTDWRLPRCFYP